MRTAPIGPSNGMPEIISAAEAALIASDVVRVLLVGADDGADDLGLVAEAVGERRAQRTVDQAAGEDRLSLGRPSRRKNEPGILPAAYMPLLDVDGQREEVDALADAAWRRWR